MARSQSWTYAISQRPAEHHEAAEVHGPPQHAPAPILVRWEKARTYEIRTYGCQMNAHDSERVAGLLEDAGYAKAADGRDPGPGRVQHLRGQGERGRPAVRQPRPPAPGQEVARGHADRRRRLPGADGARSRSSERAPWVDVVYGTHNIGALPSCSSRHGERQEAQAEFEETLATFPSPAARPPPVRRTRRGCRSRSAATTPAPSASSRRCAGARRTAAPATSWRRSRALVGDGVIEVTLLGQNVNSYGAEFGDRQAFGKLLRACGRDRGPGAGPVHLAAPAGLHRRRDRGDGATRRT